MKKESINDSFAELFDSELSHRLLVVWDKKIPASRPGWFTIFLRYVRIQAVCSLLLQDWPRTSGPVRAKCAIRLLFGSSRLAVCGRQLPGSTILALVLKLKRIQSSPFRCHRYVGSHEHHFYFLSLKFRSPSASTTPRISKSGSWFDCASRINIPDAVMSKLDSSFDHFILSLTQFADQTM